MAKDGQVCFHRRIFATVKPQRCTTEPVRLLDGINKDVSGATLLLKITTVYPVNCSIYWRHSTTVCVLMVVLIRLWLPTYPRHPLAPPTHRFYTYHLRYYSCCKRSCSKSSSVSLTEIAIRH